MSLYNDPYAECVYAWEDNFVLPHSRDLPDRDACEEFLLYASGWMDLPPPKIEFCKMPLVCWAKPQENLMRIAPWGRNRMVLLHELAHIADWQHFGQAGHGKTFVTTAMDLYSHFLGIHRRRLEDSAKRLGVYFGPPVFLAQHPEDLLPNSPAEDFFSEDF